MMILNAAVFLLSISFSFQQENSVDFSKFLSVLAYEPANCHEQKYLATCILLNCFWHDTRGCLYKTEVKCSDAHRSVVCHSLSHCFWDNDDEKCKDNEEVDCSHQKLPHQCTRFPQCYWDSDDFKCKKRKDD